MRSRFSWALKATLVFIFLSAVPATAQTPAKDAWRDFRGYAHEAGILIASQAVTDYGTSLVAQNVRIFPQDDPDGVVILIPELRIEPRGDAVALIPSPQFTINARPSRNETFTVTISHSGEIIAELGEDVMAVNMVFAQLNATLTEAMRRGQRQNVGFQIDFTGFNSRARVEREGSVDFALGADNTRYQFNFNDSNGNQTADAQILDMLIELSGAEWDMLSDEDGALRAAFDAGFFARLAMSTGANSGTSVQSFDGAQINFDSSGGASDFVIDVSDGALAVSSSAVDIDIAGGMAPFAGAGRIEEIGLTLGAPLIATPDDQRIHYGMSIEGLTLTPETLAILGAAELGADPISLVAEFSAMGRLLEEIGPSFGYGSQPPMDLTSISLDRLETSIAGAQLTGVGAFTFLGGLMASVDEDIPNGTGDFVFELIGGDLLLTRLGAMGLIPEDQQFVARMMMNGLGRPIGEDHLRSEVAIRPGGSVTVNGAPLPF